MSAKGMSFKQIVSSCVRDIVTADAEMQLAQRAAWTDLNKGFPLVEGWDHLAYLGLTEVKLTLHLEPVRRGWCARLIDFMRGRRSPKLQPYFRLCRPDSARQGCISATITVGRGDVGRTAVSTEPRTEKIEDAYVTGFAR